MNDSTHKTKKYKWNLKKKTLDLYVNTILQSTALAQKYVRATENAVSAWRIIAYMVTCLNA